MTDEYIDNITMPDGSVWLQLGCIRRGGMDGNDRYDKRIFIKLDEIASVGHGCNDHDDGSVSAAVVLKGGETINVVTTITETMEIIQEALEQNHHGLVSLCSNCRKAYQKNPKRKEHQLWKKTTK